MVEQLNEAETEAVRSIGFASFLKVDLKGREIMEITKSVTDKEYDEVHVAWVKKWNIDHNTAELTRILEFILAKKDRGEGSKRNFIIYLKLITSVRQYKESKSAKGVYYDGSLFCLMMLYLDRKADEKTETKNKDNGDKSLGKLPQKKHFSQGLTQKHKKKKNADKKEKIESKSNEELTAIKHKPVDQVAEKRKPSKDHTEKPLSKKAKREKFPQEIGKGDELTRKSAAKGEENKKSSEQITAMNAPSNDEGRQNFLRCPKTKRNIFKKPPLNWRTRKRGRRHNK
ncbi:hypothetical protein Cgig2_004594 [Carnegiea gigantea]|uniref:Uncharacterized protein n=1 Tax=Carnegiea gigantea TaxID=171969 RepID=A0A9Q1GIW1_9CARY|nr:hypothetical protein Cgig2_004594 [Carnegiea gigantea]